VKLRANKKVPITPDAMKRRMVNLAKLKFRASGTDISDSVFRFFAYLTTATHKKRSKK